MDVEEGAVFALSALAAAAARAAATLAALAFKAACFWSRLAWAAGVSAGAGAEGSEAPMLALADDPSLLTAPGMALSAESAGAGALPTGGAAGEGRG
eukprot:13038182-Alexandrium_andersonii.AAC.1